MYFPMLHIFMLKVNESKSAIMDTTNPLFIQSFIFTKKVLSDEGIKYFTKIFDELRELASLTAPFTSKEFKSIISRIYDIGNELKTNQHLHINKLDKFDKYYSSYIQPFIMLFSLFDDDTFIASSIGNTNTNSQFGHAEELEEHKDMLILQITGAVVETIADILTEMAG